MRLSRLLTVMIPLVLSLTAARLPALELPLTAREFEGLARRGEPVSAGVILPRGAVRDLGALRLSGPDGQPVPAQFETTGSWPDGSVRWLLVDFQADCRPEAAAVYTLRDNGPVAPAGGRLELSETDQGVTINTGVLRCTIGKQGFDLFQDVFLDHDRDGTLAESERVSVADGAPALALTDDRGRLISSRHGQVRSFQVEAAGPVRATIAVKGTLADRDGEAFLDYTARLHFHAGSGFTRVQLTLENHAATVPLVDEAGDRHWVMGRPGSRFFEDFSLATRLAFAGPIQLSVGDGPRELLDRVVLTAPAGIYQESSGGEHWFHRGHMNHRLEIPLRFRGAKTFLGDREPAAVDRPAAWLHAADRRFGLAVAVRRFWQNFPKALSADPDGTVRVGLWPREFPDLHELQGGEIKTHELAFFFHTGPQGSSPEENRVATVMSAFQHPLTFRAPAASYLAGGYFDDMIPYRPQQFPTFEHLMQGGVAASANTLTADIERYDEYGWRSFGDTPARNEFDESGGPHSGRYAMSHFNHEYDHGYGMLLQSLRTAGIDPELSRRWWELAAPGLQHQSDIDIYHAPADSQAHGAFDGGKFAHTSHGVEVANASHRGSPRLEWWGKLTWPWGQGQSPESGHFDNRGMICYYHLTGDRQVLESAQEMAELVYFKITNGIFPQIDIVDRTAGNNVQVLTDAYLLSWDEKYVPVVEKIIESTHPDRQWYMSAEGRRANPQGEVGGFWTAAICIEAVARWTAVIEEKTGRPYRKGREYVAAYADFIARDLAFGPEHGICAGWQADGTKSGDLGPWTYRLTDVLMYGHKFSEDPALRGRCLKAAEDCWEFMHRQYPGKNPIYHDSKSHTILSGGGHQYVYFKANGGWPSAPLSAGR